MSLKTVVFEGKVYSTLANIAHHAGKTNDASARQHLTRVGFDFESYCIQKECSPSITLTLMSQNRKRTLRLYEVKPTVQALKLSLPKAKPSVLPRGKYSEVGYEYVPGKFRR